MQDEVLADLVAALLEECGGARALETSRADTLQDLDKNSIGPLGLSGNWVAECDNGVLASSMSKGSNKIKRYNSQLGGYFI